MDEKEYKRCQVLIGISLGAVLGISIAFGNYVVPVIAIIFGLGLSQLCRRKVTEVIEDERIHRIGGKAARRTLEVGLLGMAILGIFLLTLSNAGYFELMEVGLTLSFSVCALLIISMVFYSYYSKRAEEV